MKKIFILFLILGLAKNTSAQVYADSQTTGTSGVCLGCAVSNAILAADGNLGSYSTLSLGTALAGAKVYQHLSFSIPGIPGEYVGAVVEDVGLIGLNISLLNSISLTTYSNGVSNNDTKTSSQFGIRLIGGSTSKYAIEFQATKSFDAVRVEMTAGLISAVNGINVYYGYHTLNVLPIKLAEFKTETQPNGVSLTWISQTEENLSHYTLEKSRDAETFLPITVIKGNETITENKRYGFTDEQPYEGISYYRLRTTDKNGYTEIVAVRAVNYEASTQDLDIFPNPGPHPKIKCALKENETADVYVLNSQGNLIGQYALHYGEAPLELGQLENGLYFCRVEKNNKVIKTQKLVIQ